jgi:DNA-binding transcriptional MerR regulator
MNDPEPEMLKMSVFAVRSGVPIPTIKHYLRERLLPEPVRTSKNMAYYDAALIPRVKAIKRLQTTLHLPLHVIRQVLDRAENEVMPGDVAIEATIARVLGELAPREVLSRKQLAEAGVLDEELSLFRALGIIAPDLSGGTERYVGDDVTLLRLLGQARRAGLSAKMLPPEILRAYVEALGNLVRVELQMFRAGVLPIAGNDLAKLSEVATTLSERLVVLLRRKLLLPTLRSLVEEPTPASAPID